MPIAAHLLGRGFEVTGVDLSPTLLASARAALPTGRWIEADLRALELRERFDGIVLWHAQFHLRPDDQRSLLAALQGLAKPHAAALFTTGSTSGRSTGELGGDPLEHFSLDPAEYERMLGASGFELVDARIEDPTCGGATVWLAVRSERAPT